MDQYLVTANWSSVYSNQPSDTANTLRGCRISVSKSYLQAVKRYRAFPRWPRCELYEYIQDLRDDA